MTSTERTPDTPNRTHRRRRSPFVLLVALLALIGAGLVVPRILSGEGGPHVTFDGENCEYTGPTSLTAGLTEFELTNQSAREISIIVSSLVDDASTVQDVQDYFGTQPVTGPGQILGRFNWQDVGADSVASIAFGLGEDRYVVACLRHAGDPLTPTFYMHAAEIVTVNVG